MNTVFKDCVKIILVDHLGATEGESSLFTFRCSEFCFSPPPLLSLFLISTAWPTVVVATPLVLLTDSSSSFAVAGY